MIQGPPVARIRVPTAMPAVRTMERLGSLVQPQDAAAVSPGEFHFAGRLDGAAFQFRRVGRRGPLSQFVVPVVTGVVEPTQDGSLIDATIRATPWIALPPAVVMGYAYLRTGPDDARFLLPFAAVLALGLTGWALVEEIGRVRRFLKGLAGPPGDS